MRDNKHEFAIYAQGLSSYLDQSGAKGSLLVFFAITDENIIHRLVQVLRVQQGQTIVLFDARIFAHGEIVELQKKHVLIRVLSSHQHEPLQPSITVGLPLLKREAFEEAIYSAVELGATAVQLLITEKTQRSWSEKERDRMQRIMIAAAEQSKNFVLPTIHDAVELESYCLVIQKQTVPKIFFDPQGSSFLSLLTQLSQQKSQELVMIVGPEGDLTDHEKAMLKSAGCHFSALTPTVLRAQQAIVVGLGSLRACLRKEK